MRNFYTAVSAALTAVIIGLLIANVASSARAAEIEHAKAQEMAAVEAAYSDEDVRAQLAAYQVRYEQAYKQLAAAYQELVDREAAYRALWQQASGTGAQLSATNADLDARLAAAYAALDSAQAAVNDLARTAGTGGGTVSAPAAAPAAPAAATPKPKTPSPTPRATTPRPATPTPVRVGTATPKATYCWYDNDGKWVCEDHPQGQ